jgi:hypothetical protein
MAVNLSPVGGAAVQFFDNSGNVLTGGKLYTYLAGTTTPAATFTSNTGLIFHSNPIILDAAGRVPAGGEIWLTNGQEYKFVLETSTNVQLLSVDNISGNGDPTSLFYTPAPDSLLAPGPLTVKSALDQITNDEDGSSTIGFIQAGLSAVARTAQSKMRETISVKDFGAVGDGTTDDTVAIQAAIDAAATIGHSSNYGAAVFFPSGRYIISATIDLPGAQYVSLFGEGKPSIISWDGGSPGVMFSMDNGTDESQIFIEKLHFIDPVDDNSVTGFEFCKTPGNAIVNVTFRQNLFSNLNLGIDMYQETDQMLIDDNYFLTYYDSAVKVLGYCANIYVKNNHFRDGKDDSYAVVFSDGNSLVIDTNTVQTAVNGAKGFYISASTKFSVTNTYFEVAAGGAVGDGPFLTMFGAKDGYVANNYTTGACGDSVMVVDANCRVITFGDHRHSVSGGTPTRILEVDGAPAGISVIGTFDTNNVQILPFSGQVDYFLGLGNSSNNSSFTTPLIYASKPVNQYRDLTNIASSTTADLIDFGTQSGAWQIYALNITERYWSISFVSSDGTTAAIANTYQSNANLVLSVTGNKLQAANGVTATRTIQFSATRIF